MKIIFFTICLFTLNILIAQNEQIQDLENQKNTISQKIEVLRDSIKKIDSKINKIKSSDIRKMLSDSSIVANTTNGAKLKLTPDPFAKPILLLPKNTTVILLDYYNGYFGVCTDTICGYLSDIWIQRTIEVQNLINIKEEEEKELKSLANERYLKKQESAWKEIEKKYIAKYGAKTYNKLKTGNYWTGMSKKMTVISLGKPNESNRTIGSWGVHEQWVYDNDLYLYFENGILKAFQD